MKDIRIGKVSAVHYDTGMVDVLFEDEEDLVRRNLPLFSAEYLMPSVNDLVTVIFQSNSGTAEQGYVIGVPYTDHNRPVRAGRGVYYKRFSDTAYLYYDPDSDTLEISAGKVVIKNMEAG